MNERLLEIERLLDEVLEMDVPKDPEHRHDARETLDRIIGKLSRRLGTNYVLERIIRSNEPQIYNLMTSPFAGRPRQEIIEFIKKVFKGSSTIEIFDAYFFNSNDDNKEEYLNFLKEVKIVLVEIEVSELIVHYLDESYATKVLFDVEQIFTCDHFTFVKQTEYKKYLHDRFWLGYKLMNVEEKRTIENMFPDPTGVYFGSSFNNVFKKPMFYNVINNDDFCEILKCFRSISELESSDHENIDGKGEVN